MAIGDWSAYTWQKGVDVANANNFQNFDDKIYELDKYAMPKFVYKESDEYVNNTTVLNDDDELIITLEANKVFEIDTNLYVDTNTSAGFKMAWDVSNANLINYRCIDGSTFTGALYSFDAYLHRGAVSSFTDSTGQLFAGYNHEKMLVETMTSGTTATLTLQWSQVVATAVNTYVKAGSFIKVAEIKEFD